jgi:hypothetical protein
MGSSRRRRSLHLTGLLGIYSDPATQLHTYADGRQEQFAGVVFLAETVRLLTGHDHEIAEVGFFDPDQLPSPVFGPDRPVLSDFKEKRTVPIIG